MMRMHQALQSTQLPCACTALRKASRAVSRVYDAALADVGLSTPQLALLRAIQREEGRPLSRLAEEMVMDRTSLYRALTPMVRSGWVRIEDAGSGRTKLVHLTSEGRAATDGAAPHWEAAQARMVEAFGVERWRDLSRSILALAEVGAALAP
jgi:DNA-binding MarR family transcriptional regulator